MLLDKNMTKEAYELSKSLIEMNLYAGISYDDIRNLEGKMLTIIDACITDIKQREAIKSLIRKDIWFSWVAGLQFKSEPERPIGMPLVLENIK